MVFIESPIFTRLMQELLTDDSYARLQQFLEANPDAGDVIQGTGGLRNPTVAKTSRFAAHYGNESQLTERALRAVTAVVSAIIRSHQRCDRETLRKTRFEPAMLSRDALLSNFLCNTGGKIRWSTEGRGKRGGMRVIYFHISAECQIRMLLVYKKGRQDNLTPEQKRRLLKIQQEWDR